MTLQEAITRANELQNKIGETYQGNRISYVIPAPVQKDLCKTYTGEYYHLYNEQEKQEMNYIAFYQTIHEEKFGVVYLCAGKKPSPLLISLVEQ
jgi:hypothetical protein